MAASRRSATKQRRRGSSGSAQTADADATTVETAAQAAEPKKQQASASTKSSAGKQTASAQTSQVGKFRTSWEKFRKAIQNTISEIKKVTWPDAETTRNLTVLVIAMSTFLGLLLGGIDFLLLKVFELF